MYLGKRIHIVLLLFWSCKILLSQGLSHQVIVPVGAVQCTPAIHYSQTIGEAAVEIFRNTDLVLTQGFQQPGIRLKTENAPAGNGLKVYPNPVRDYVTVELYGTGKRTFIIDFFNITGSITRTEKIEFSDTYWLCQPFSVEHYSQGLFFIRITSTDGIFNRTFKIEKL